MPGLSNQASELNQYLPELIQLQKVKDNAAEDLVRADLVEAQASKVALDPVVDQEAWANVYQAAMPLKNDFVFNFDEFENQKREIHERQQQRSNEQSELISDILAVKKSDGAATDPPPPKDATFTGAFAASKKELEEQYQDMGKTIPSKSALQTIEDHSLTLQISKAAEEKFQGAEQRNVVGTTFSYQLPADEVAAEAEQPAEPEK